MTDLLEHVEQTLRARRLIRRRERVLAAVSGGLDSMVLLHCLHILSAKLGFELTVAHFNHQLRGPASEADAELVKATARKLRLAFAARKSDVRKQAALHGVSIEMAARDLRHTFLAETADRLECRTIALAHHADDQVETLFLRLLRGSGSEGLAGMKWRNPSPADSRFQVIRPFLDLSKADLESFARENAVAFRHDESNDSLDIRRNRIRHELIPLLKSHYQPAMARAVLRAMDILSEESEFVTEAARQWLRQRTRVSFDRLPVAVQRRCLQIQLQRLGQQPDFELIEELRNSSKLTINLNETISIFRDKNGLVRLHEHVEPPSFSSNQLAIQLNVRPCRASFDGCAFRWSTFPHKKEKLKRSRGQKESFDAAKIGSQIVLRHWRPGDRFQPIGMSKPVKLQDWFTNQKVPRTRRHDLVLAEAESGEIFWIEGQRISERFKLTPATRTELEWRWQRTS